MAVLNTLEHPLTVEETDCGGSIECGFRQEWMTAKNDKMAVELSSGAGLGSPWIQLTVTVDGEKRYFRANMSDFVQRFVDDVIGDKEPA